MKLHEINGDGFLKDEVEIRKWITEHCIDGLQEDVISDNYIKVRADGVVDIHRPDVLFCENFTKFKVRFGTIFGNCLFEDIGGPSDKITSLSGCPQVVLGDFDISNRLGSIQNMKDGPKAVDGYYDITQCSSINSLEGIPSCIKVLHICNTSIHSLIGISELFPKLQYLSVANGQIDEGGLGLLQCEDFKCVKDFRFRTRMVEEWQEIINKYAGTDNIIECQSELIEAGLEEYAVL